MGVNLRQWRQSADGVPIWAMSGSDEAVADHVSRHVRADRETRIAIAGGATPRPILDILRKRALPWHRTRLVPTDERLVSGMHPDSNYGMLSYGLDDTAALVEPLVSSQPVGHLDLVWLGMAEDGKIASLFTPADTEIESDTGTALTRPRPGSGHVEHARRTLTLASIVDADDIILVIRGEAKRRVVERALDNPGTLPVSKLFMTARKPVRIFWRR